MQPSLLSLGLFQLDLVDLCDVNWSGVGTVGDERKGMPAVAAEVGVEVDVGFVVVVVVKIVRTIRSLESEFGYLELYL